MISHASQVENRIGKIIAKGRIWSYSVAPREERGLYSAKLRPLHLRHYKILMHLISDACLSNIMLIFERSFSLPPTVFIKCKDYAPVRKLYIRTGAVHPGAYGTSPLGGKRAYAPLVRLRLLRYIRSS